MCRLFYFCQYNFDPKVHPHMHSIHSLKRGRVHSPTYLTVLLLAAILGVFIYPLNMASVQALKKVDYNTQTYFSLLHMMGSSRRSAVPNGSAVNLPEEKRDLPSKKALEGIKVPTYDQVRFGEIDGACALANACRA